MDACVSVCASVCLCVHVCMRMGGVAMNPLPPDPYCLLNFARIQGPPCCMCVCVCVCVCARVCVCVCASMTIVVRSGT